MKKILLLLALFIGMSSYSDTVIVENSSSYDAHLIFTVRNADCENPFMLYTLNVDSGSNNSIYLPSGIKPKSVNILLSSDNCSSSGNAGGFRIGSPNSSCNGYSCTSSNFCWYRLLIILSILGMSLNSVVVLFIISKIVLML